MKPGQYTLISVIVISLFLAPGCFKEIVETRDELPDIVWPSPPEIPRIHFVNSVTKPEDLNIMNGLAERLWNFIKGKVTAAIVKPYGIITDKEGRLYVIDNFSRNVHVFNQGSREYYAFPEEETVMQSPIDIAIDRNGTIYVSDSKDGVIKVFKDHGKQYVKDIGKELLSRPAGLAYNVKTDELLVVDTKYAEIIRYDIETLTYKGKIGGMGMEHGAFNNPTNVFVDRDGQIYVSDSLNFRIQVFDQEGNFVRTFGKGGDSPGYFSRPKGVAVDSDGNIYVVDALFDNVQIFNEQGELLMDFGSSGRDYGKFWLPAGIYIDEQDMIYVSDSYNHRVQIFRYLKSGALP